MRRENRPRQRRSALPGIALLDVVISLAVLGLSGTAFITLLGQTSHSVRNVRNTERQVRRAADALGRFTEYDRSKLVAMVGRSAVREWVVAVSQPASGLFDVSVINTLTGAAVLATTFYRPETTHAP